MNKNINPELRTYTRMSKMLAPSRVWSFKLYQKFMNKTVLKPTLGLSYDQVYIPRSSSQGNIRTVIYKGKKADIAEPLPVILYLHGGGYAIGLPEMAGENIKRWMKTRNAIYVVPQYRRSLEAPYPAAIDDCYDALLWIRDNIETIGGDITNIGVMGHSAGGGLTAALTLRNRDRNDMKLAWQMPIYPMIDDRFITPSSQIPNLPVWNARTNRIGWSLYLKDLHKRKADIPYDAAPARCDDYSGLPPTFTFVGDQDTFLDETKHYVEALRRAKVPVKFKIFEGGFHGYEQFVPKAQISRETNAYLLDSLAEAIDGHFETWA